MADIGWRLPPPTHFHASGRRFTHNSSGQSKNPLTAIMVSTAISEMSSQIIPLKDRADFRNSSRILATEIIRVEPRRWGYAARLAQHARGRPLANVGQRGLTAVA